MAASNSTDSTVEQLKRFLFRGRRKANHPIKAISTFCGCGLSDTGYQLAGFDFLAQVEKDTVRAEIGQENFPDSQWIALPLARAVPPVVKRVQAARVTVDVLIATPPCQGLSSSNPSRGKRQTDKARRHSAKNRLVLDILPLVEKLSPRVIIAENVRQVLTHRARRNGRVASVPELLAAGLPEYELFTGTINVADYGVPQIRRRAILVAVRRDESWLDDLLTNQLAPWPRQTHSEGGKEPRTREWVTVKRWLKAMSYERLSSESSKRATGKHPLHSVPAYDADRYTLVSSIPKYTGQSAYNTDWCRSCNAVGIESGLAVCPNCGEVLSTRPIVRSRRSARLIKGFKSSYRRMRADRPASTVTTNSSHIGSDNKIHPWEHRVLSALECADLQTVPRFFKWECAYDSGRVYLIRNLIGEAFPPYFTYLHGLVLKRLLAGEQVARSSLACYGGQRSAKVA